MEYVKFFYFVFSTSFSSYGLYLGGADYRNQKDPNIDLIFRGRVWGL